jgi:ubiquitin-protein ligase
MNDNIKILKELERYFENNPHMRFIQGLFHSGVIHTTGSGCIDSLGNKFEDKYRELSSTTLARLIENIGED